INQETYNMMVLWICHKLSDYDQSDKYIIDTFTTIEELSKSINKKYTRIRDWYSIHFPELSRITDIKEYLNGILKIGNRIKYVSDIHDSEILDNDSNGDNEGKGHDDSNGSNGDDGTKLNDEIKKLALNSMGIEISDHDISKIQESSRDILMDLERKENLMKILEAKCESSFPNLFFLIGSTLLSRFLLKTGSISKFSQLPSSTIQILGAEKSFNQAIKNKKNTPKYGFIYDSFFVNSIDDKEKGRISRILSNKIALCSRVDLQRLDKEGNFGKKCKKGIEKIISSLNDRKRIKKPKLKQKKRVVTIEDYDQSKDSKKMKL
ncbi:MAG: hypothetical protein KC414_14940, partial [Romboutsia sp.]|nr:hypothetical protein [Romboutsia sp.]